jgi:hypothetical protein
MATSAGFEWKVTPNLAFNELAQNYSRVIFQSGRNIAYEQAEAMEQYAKEHAPWTDQTGDARERLHATVEETGPIGTIVLAHGVEYGVWLEIANGGRYSIIPQTVDVFGPRVMRSLQNMINLGHAAR